MDLKFYKNSIIIALILMPFSLSVQAGWDLQWIDSFNDNQVNWQNWTAQIQANYNNEVQCYTDDESSATQNYQVSSGSLKIIARKQAINCPGLNGAAKTWTSGRLNSKDKREFLYGRVEARIKFHNLQGGTWPAFWMLENRIAEHPKKNDDDFSQWPQPGAGEIDVWEWFSNEPNTYITNFFNTNGCGSEVRYTYPNGGSDVLQWHKYAMEWDENTIRFYIDETLVTSQDVSNCAQYKEPMFVLLNVAMGGNLGGSIDNSLQKATMEVDYVAHCMPTADNNSQFCDESLTADIDPDDDQDGVNNSIDLCPATPIGATVDSDGCITDNQTPIAVATGPSAVIYAGNNVQLSATDSSDVDGDPLSYLWSQTSGPKVVLSNEKSATPTFIAPTVSEAKTLVFSLTVADATTSDTTQLSINIDVKIDSAVENNDTTDSSGDGSSGGSLPIVSLLALLLILIVTRQRKLIRL